MKDIFKKKEIWIAALIGFILGAVLLFVIQFIPGVKNIFSISNKTIAKTKAGNLKEEEVSRQVYDIYLKNRPDYLLALELDKIDSKILNKKYKLTKDQKEEIAKDIEDILKAVEESGQTEDSYYSENGFSGREDFEEYVALDYLKKLYLADYLKSKIDKEKIENYYNTNDIYGKISTKQILVIKSSTEEGNELDIAKEIIAKLDEGKNFDEVASEYKNSEKYSNIILVQDVDFDSFDEINYIQSYTSASKALEVGTYTKEPVETSYGYHIIYCANKEEKPTMQDVENEILLQIGTKEDPYVLYKSLIDLREEYKLDFKDEKMEEEYQEYCEQINQL